MQGSIRFTTFACSLGFALSFGSPVVFEQKGSRFLANPDNAQLHTYSVTQRTLSNSAVDKILAVFERRGFVSNDSKRNLSSRAFLSNKGDRWINFDNSVSGFQYYDQSAKELTVSESSNHSILKDSSDKILAELQGVQAADYVLTHVEDSYMVGKDTPKQLTSRTFRYVRKIDDRLVEGTTSHIRITIGEKGGVQAVDLRDPVIAKKRKVRARAKRAWLRSKLEADIQKQDGESQVKVARHLIKNTVNTLTLDGEGPEANLVPSLLFTVVNEAQDGKLETVEMSLKEDADQLENLRPEDTEAQQPSNK